MYKLLALANIGRRERMRTMTPAACNVAMYEARLCDSATDDDALLVTYIADGRIYRAKVELV
jgi:hypothetical protein